MPKKWFSRVPGCDHSIEEMATRILRWIKWLRCSYVFLTRMFRMLEISLVIRMFHFLQYFPSHVHKPRASESPGTLLQPRRRQHQGAATTSSWLTDRGRARWIAVSDRFGSLEQAGATKPSHKKHDKERLLCCRAQYAGDRPMPRGTASISETAFGVPEWCTTKER